jgi:dGTPase
VAAETRDRKFGAYDDDLAVLAWLREGSPSRRPCLEARIVDWADDAGQRRQRLGRTLCAPGLIVPAQLASRHERATVADLAARRMTTQPKSVVEHAATDLMDLPPRPHCSLGTTAPTRPN